MTNALKYFSLTAGLLCACSLTHANNAELDSSTPNSTHNLAPHMHSPLSHEGYYMGFSGGVADPTKFNTSLQSGYTLGAHYGYYDTNYRTELTLNFINNDIYHLTANYSIFNLMLNAYYDFNFAGIIVPFVGVGVGYAHAWRDDCTTQTNCTILQVGNKFAYQGLAGIGLHIKNHTRIDLRYRYFALDHSQNFAENAYELMINYFFQ